MCELMAMSFEAPISADFSIREFAARGEENPDGWGLGWYPDRSLAVVKEPVRVGREPPRRLPRVVSERPEPDLSSPTSATRRWAASRATPTPTPSPASWAGATTASPTTGRSTAPRGTSRSAAYRPLGDDRLGAVLLPPPPRDRRRGGPLDDPGRLAMAPRDAGLGQPVRQAQLPALRRPSAVRLPRRQRLEGPELPQGPGPRGPAPPLRRRDPLGRPRRPGRSTTASWSRPARSARPAGTPSGSAS